MSNIYKNPTGNPINTRIGSYDYGDSISVIKTITHKRVLEGGDNNEQIKIRHGLGAFHDFWGMCKIPEYGISTLPFIVDEEQINPMVVSNLQISAYIMHEKTDNEFIYFIAANITGEVELYLMFLDNANN